MNLKITKSLKEHCIFISLLNKYKGNNVMKICINFLLIILIITSCRIKSLPKVDSQEILQSQTKNEITGVTENKIQILEEENSELKSEPKIEEFTPEKEKYLISKFQNTRYFKDGKIVHNMFVNAGDGLRVRKSPDLNSEKLDTIPFMQSVKIISIGDTVTIDDINDNWVKILLPRYLWENGEAEYGWVFGGYLSYEKPSFSLETESLAEIEALLRSKIWKLKDKRYVYEFNKDNTLSGGLLYSGGCFFGSYKINKNSIYTEMEIGDEFQSRKEVETLDLKILSEDLIILGESEYESWINPDQKKSTGQIYSDYHGENIYNYVFKSKIYSNDDNPNYSEERKNDFIIFLIESGVSPSGTEYEDQFHDYWKQVMYEQQKNYSN